MTMASLLYIQLFWRGGGGSVARVRRWIGGKRGGVRPMGMRLAPRHWQTRVGPGREMMANWRGGERQADVVVDR
ncbi:UNVERIFIED_CONTAM: hypothetical protein Sindi_0940100 [Sesamum indicum]